MVLVQEPGLAEEAELMPLYLGDSLDPFRPHRHPIYHAEECSPLSKYPIHVLYCCRDPLNTLSPLESGSADGRFMWT